MRNSHDKPYKSFFDVIEGKEARFHEYIYICQFSLFVTFQTCLKKKIKHFITVLEVHKLILVYFFEKIDRTCIYGLMKSHKVFFDNNLLLIGLFQ
jgi:hypothetical protein